MMLVLWGAALAGSPAYDLLKQRDAVSCAELGEATPALRDELLALTAPERLPAAVPMRAAGCLAERFPDDPEVQAAFRAWPADPARPGQVLLLLARVDTLPEPVAAALVRGALVAPNDRVRRKAEAVRTAVPGVEPAP